MNPKIKPFDETIYVTRPFLPPLADFCKGLEEIETGEIENALCRIGQVSQAAALHGTRRGLSRIIAVVSAKDSPNPGELQKTLKEMLPDYMIPSEIHVLNELPKNPNGKIDRPKLREIYFGDAPSVCHNRQGE
jgi:acyl-coenzyme A synthetase/AMP-(fatty) acid ligase